MNRIEYRIETISTNGHGSPEQQLVERLNQLGSEGWRVSSMQVEARSSYGLASTEVLLERDTADGEDFHRMVTPGA